MFIMDQIEKPIPITPRIEPVMITAAVILLILIREHVDKPTEKPHQVAKRDLVHLTNLF